MKPKFSVIIALAPSRHAEVLASLQKVDYDQKMLQIIIKKGLNPSENRNNGCKEATGEILAFIDDDAIVDRNIFQRAEEFFSRHPDIDLVGGPQLTPENDGFFAKTSGFVLESWFGTHAMRCRYKRCKENLDANETCITSANCFIRRSCFLKTSGFNPALFPGEDPEFFTRIKNEGLRIAYSPDLIVHHRRRDSLGGFCRQFYKYGKTRCLKEKLNKQKAGLLFLMPMFFVGYVVVGGVLSFLHAAFLLPLLLYFFIDFLVSLWMGLHRGLHRIPLLIMLFFLLHTSYGLGMIAYFLSGKKAFYRLGK